MSEEDPGLASFAMRELLRALGYDPSDVATASLSVHKHFDYEMSEGFGSGDILIPNVRVHTFKLPRVDGRS